MSSTVNTPPSGFRRFAGLLNLATRSSVAIAAVTVTLQIFLPEPYKPSRLIGGTVGGIEANTIEAHTQASADLARQMAEAQVQAQVQAQKMNDALEAQATAANMADFACIAGLLMGGPSASADFNQDAVGATGNALSKGCGMGDKIRDNMSRIIERNGQLPAQ